MVDLQMIELWQGSLRGVGTMATYRFFVTAMERFNFFFTVLVKNYCRGISFELNSEAYLELCQTSMVYFFCKNS